MTNIEFITLKSSNLDAVAFIPQKEDETIGSLHIRFKNGAEFAYYEVPAEKYKDFMSAESHGKFYIQHIKGNYEHECTKKSELNLKRKKKVDSQKHTQDAIRTGFIDF